MEAMSSFNKTVDGQPLAEWEYRAWEEIQRQPAAKQRPVEEKKEADMRSVLGRL